MEDPALKTRFGLPRLLSDMRRKLHASGLAATALLASSAARAEDLHVGLPVDVSRDGHLIDHSIHYTTACITTLFVIMVVIMVYAMIAHREGRAKALYDHGDSRKALLFTAAVLGMVFVVVDVVELVSAYTDVSTIFWHFPDDSEVFKVEVMAQQWAWNIRLAGADGKFNTEDDIVKLNELHVPVGKKVLLQLKSKDVIHSFYLPNMRMKQDAVPGMITRMWFVPTTPGEWEIGCAQHCGANHYKMRGDIFVHDEASFKAWSEDGVNDTQRRTDPNDAEAHWGWDWEGAKEGNVKEAMK